jgi:hypothetical protein
MTQTLLGLTFKEAVRIADAEGACANQLKLLNACGSWGNVLKNSRLRGWVAWMSDAEVPLKDCSCAICEAKATRLTPEKTARAEVLRAIYDEAMKLEAGPEETHDFIEAKLRERLSEALAPEGWTHAEALHQERLALRRFHRSGVGRSRQARREKACMGLPPLPGAT